MKKLNQCRNGHFYEGDTCPYCPTQFYAVGKGAVTERRAVGNSHTEIVNMPICPHCGSAVRRSMPNPSFPIIGSIGGNAYDRKVPWNYGWDGRCENCGHDFSFTMTQKINSPYNDRQTIVRVSAKKIQEKGYEGTALMDAFVGLSGVEIEQRNSVDGVQKIFISTNELKYIANVLKNSPILEQLDWSEDRT